MLSLIATLILAQGDCQYRMMEIADLNDWTVLHVRTISPEGEIRNFGYEVDRQGREYGIYPWVVKFEWCGPGSVVEYRTGRECTVWDPVNEIMARQKGPDGRQIPCSFSDWARIPEQSLPPPAPPESISV